MTKPAAQMLAKLNTYAFLMFSRKAKGRIAAALELQAAGLVIFSAHCNNELKVELKK